MIQTSQQIVSALVSDFKLYPGLNTTGDIKKNTERMVDNYVNSVLVAAIGNKALDVHEEYNMPIDGTFSINLDKAVVRRSREVKLHVEQKSYGDIDMLKRFVADNHSLVQHYPQLINVAICLQPNTPLDTFTSCCKQYSHVSYGKNTFLFTLTEKSRLYRKDKEYLLEYEESYLIHRTELIIQEVSKLL